MTVDAFLAAYFRTLERRESAQCASMEARGRGTFEAARTAEHAFAWASGLMGTLARQGRLTDAHRAVLRAVYLSLTVEHVALIRMRSPGQRTADVVGRVHLDPRHPQPPPAAEVQSFVSWRSLADALDLPLRRVRRLWTEGRAVVAEELEIRGSSVVHCATMGQLIEPVHHPGIASRQIPTRL